MIKKWKTDFRRRNCQGTAAGVWRAMPQRMKARGLFLGAGAGQDHRQFWELGVGLFSPALIDYATANLTDTPLPATWTMMLTGVCALGLLGWRKKRKSAAA